MTANDVYVNALGLYDELDADGTVSEATDEQYSGKVIPVLNILMREVARYENAAYVNLTSLSDDICVSDDAGERILPYGLAANFALADKNMEFYTAYQNEYNRGLSTLPAIETDIKDDMRAIYGLGYPRSE